MVRPILSEFAATLHRLLHFIPLIHSLPLSLSLQSRFFSRLSASFEPMTDEGGGAAADRNLLVEHTSFQRPKFGTFLHSEPTLSLDQDDTIFDDSHSPRSFDGFYNDDASHSPFFMWPLNDHPSPYNKSPWVRASPLMPPGEDKNLIGSLVREEGHVYSLAASGGLLYTGSDSKNIRVWKNLKDFSGFKSSSGLVKAIVISGDKIFTGHQDGKIRIWKFSAKNQKNPYKRIGSLPTNIDFLRSSFNPKSYVEVRRRRVPWIKHYDAVSCLSLDEDQGLLYSGSWDRTLKVWRISDSKCLESVTAHDDAVNSVACFEGLVLTGSADGKVKVWSRELLGKTSKHTLIQTLLKQESAVTAVAVNSAAQLIYCGSSDGLVSFWERQKELSHGGVLRGHKLAVLCLAAAGSLVFSGSADKTICVWRRMAGGDHVCLSVLGGHVGPVKCLAVEKDREREGGKGEQRWILYSGSLDKSVKVWRVGEQLPDLRQLHYV